MIRYLPFLTGVFFSLLIPAFTFAAGDDHALAIVDFRRLYDYYVQLREVNASVKKKKASFLKRMQAREKKILYRKQRLKEKRNDLSEKELRRLHQEIAFLESELKVFLYDRKKELEVFQEEAVQKVIKAVYLEVRKYARKQKYRLVIDKDQSIIMVDVKHAKDITAVIERILEKRARRFSLN